MKTLKQEFGDRLLTLNVGAHGLRGGFHAVCKEVAGTDPILDMIASDDTLDRYNEVIRIEAWRDGLDNFLANPVVPDCHNYSSTAFILGRDILPKDQQIANGKLQARVLFATDNPLAMMNFNMGRKGFIRTMSVGFIPIEFQNGVGNDQPSRIYTKCELLEKSIVVVPANPGATVGLALKSGAITKADVRKVIDFLMPFCSDDAVPPPTPRTPGGTDNGVRLLQLARSLRDTLARA